MGRPGEPPPRGGLVVVDKPAGMTSHDVVARIRRLAGTRRVGHAGTLDPMATGVLLVGVGRATRLLGHLALHDKDYLATARLGQTTSTDDAEGELLASVAADRIDGAEIAAAAKAFVGDIVQRPPAVSAIKVDGRRAYARVRAGEDVVLAERPAHVERFDVVATRPGPASTLDVDLAVTCSSGTYVRALARDLGAALEVGAHLVALRRTRVGAFGLDVAVTLDELERQFRLTPLEAVAAQSFTRFDLDADQAAVVAHGGRLAAAPAVGREGEQGSAGLLAAFGPDGEFLALLEVIGGIARPVAVFTA